MRLLDPRPQRGLLRRWLFRSAIAGVLLGVFQVAVTGRRDDWATVMVGTAVIAFCAVLIVRAVVRRDPWGWAMADDW
jgi:hypothetical protein